METTVYNKHLGDAPIALTECADGTVRMHSHTFFEFAYVVSGKAEHTINDRTFLLLEGDYFLINLNDSHGYRQIAGTDGFRIINCLFRPGFIDETLANAGSFGELLNDVLREYGPRNSRHVTLRSYHDRDGFVGTLMRKMLTEYREKQTGYEELLRTCLISLLICLVRNDPEHGTRGTITPFIKNYVAKHYAEPIGLSDLCRELNFSLTHLSVTFKAETGLSFRDYLIKVRMEKACRLLRTTDRTVSEVSALVGYSDPAFFYKAFRKTLGLTPTEYREKANLS